MARRRRTTPRTIGEPVYVSGDPPGASQSVASFAIRIDSPLPIHRRHVDMRAPGVVKIRWIADDEIKRPLDIREQVASHSREPPREAKPAFSAAIRKAASLMSENTSSLHIELLATATRPALEPQPKSSARPTTGMPLR
jgi:hypothetical protein